MDSMDYGFAEACEVLGMQIIGDGAEVIDKDFKECDSVGGGLELLEGVHALEHGVLKGMVREGG